MPTLGIALLPHYSPQRYQRLAKCYEDLGYTNLWVPDERFWRDMAVCMSQVIMATDTVRVGSSVTDPYVRHPALTARIMATLDELAGGRVVVGFAAGVSGFQALGIQRRHPVRAISEAVDLMRKLWAGENVDYQGELIQFHGGGLDFEPLHSRIPVYVAGRGPHILALAGEIGDGAIIGSLASPPALDYALKRIDVGLARSSRGRTDLDIALWLHTAIAEDSKSAQQAVRQIVTGALISSLDVVDDLGLDIPQEVQNSLQRVNYRFNSPDMQQAQSLIGPDIIRHFALAGTPDECRRQIRQIVEAGVNHIAIVPWLVPGQSPEEFADSLMKSLGPALNESSR